MITSGADRGEKRCHYKDTQPPVGVMWQQKDYWTPRDTIIPAEQQVTPISLHVYMPVTELVGNKHMVQSDPCDLSCFFVVTFNQKYISKAINFKKKTKKKPCSSVKQDDLGAPVVY